MKAILVIIFSVSVIACNAQTASKKADVSQVQWLVGKWARTGMKPGRSGYETWTNRNSSELMGRGVMLKGADTAFVEKIKIVVKDSELYYVADVPENKSEVYFKVTELKANSFTCENPQHDFPKKIAYSVEGDVLKATISGDGKVIDYWFKKE
jgi:Domain of unknown function (DUF6265)